MEPNQPPEHRPQPRLVTRGKFVLILLAVMAGVVWCFVREYRTEGRISTVTIASGIAAFVVGLAILLVVTWYANKSEK